jgi:hypothetical protein
MSKVKCPASRNARNPGGYYVDEELTASELTLVERTLMGGIRTLCKGDPAATPGSYKYGGMWSETDKACSARLNMPLRTMREARRTLTKKGWLSGRKVDGDVMAVRMPLSWYEDRNIEPQSTLKLDVKQVTVGVTSVTGGETPVTSDVTPVPCDVTPSDKRGISDLGEKISEAPVAPAGAAATEAETGSGASLILLEENTAAGTCQPVPMLTPDIEQALRAEAEAWTQQVAWIINRQTESFLPPFPVKNRDGVIRKLDRKAVTGSTPWPGDCAKVLALAYEFDLPRVDLSDPLAVFRAYLRLRAGSKPLRQGLQAYAFRVAQEATAKSKGVSLDSALTLTVTPQIKIAALFRKPLDHEELLENINLCCTTSCFQSPDADIECALRKDLDPRNRYGDAVWDRCWKEASARCKAAEVPARFYGELVKHNVELGVPMPWVADSLEIRDVENTYDSYKYDHLDCQ